MLTVDEMLAWNNALIADFRAHGGAITSGPMAGRTLLLLTTTGVTSGEPRVSPLAYTRDGDRYVVIASNAGKRSNPAWLANLRAAAEVAVEVGSETFRARATVTTGDERRRLFNAQAAVMPGFADYERMTEREIPVVTLEPVDRD